MAGHALRVFLETSQQIIDHFPEVQRRYCQDIAEIIQWLEDILININDNDIGVDPMDPEDIEAIPTALMNQEMSDKSSACPICIGSFLKEEEVLVLQCGHFYHAA